MKNIGTEGRKIVRLVLIGCICFVDGAWASVMTVSVACDVQTIVLGFAVMPRC